MAFCYLSSFLHLGGVLGPVHSEWIRSLHCLQRFQVTAVVAAPSLQRKSRSEQHEANIFPSLQAFIHSALNSFDQRSCCSQCVLETRADSPRLLLAAASH